jgi:hypothetical protein
MLNASVGTVAVATTQSQASLAGTLVDANGSILLGKTAGNAATTNITAGLTTGNTATWTGALKSAIAWDGTGRSLVLNNGTVATDATAMTPGTTLHVGSTSGSSAFLNGYVSKLGAWNSRQSNGSIGTLP